MYRQLPPILVPEELVCHLGNLGPVAEPPSMATQLAKYTNHCNSDPKLCAKRYLEPTILCLLVCRMRVRYVSRSCWEPVHYMVRSAGFVVEATYAHRRKSNCAAHYAIWHPNTLRQTIPSTIKDECHQKQVYRHLWRPENGTKENVSFLKINIVFKFAHWRPR